MTTYRNDPPQTETASKPLIINTFVETLSKSIQSLESEIEYLFEITTPLRVSLPFNHSPQPDISYTPDTGSLIYKLETLINKIESINKEVSHIANCFLDQPNPPNQTH